MKRNESEPNIIRNQGNEIYKTCSLDLPLTILKERVYKCVNLYEISERLSLEQDEKFKSNKNLALAYLKILQKLSLVYENKHFDEFFYFMSESLKRYMSALKFGKIEIQNDLSEKIIDLVISYINKVNSCQETKNEDFIIKLIKIKDIVTWNYPKIQFHIFITIIKKYLRRGIEDYDDRFYVKANSKFENCLEFTREALYFKNKLEKIQIDDLSGIEEDCIFYIFRCDASRYIQESDNIFRKAVFEEENLQFDMIIICLDKLREALMQIECREEKSFDVELAAIAYSKLAVIFHKIIKNASKGGLYAKESVDLGMSLLPKNVEIEQWFKNSKEILAEIRKKKEKEEADEIRESKKKYLNELKDIIYDLTSKSTSYSIEKFMKHILDKHPATEESRNYKVDEEKAKSCIKKVILKVISFYHPDKFTKEDLKKKY